MGKLLKKKRAMHPGALRRKKWERKTTSLPLSFLFSSVGDRKAPLFSTLFCPDASPAL